MSEKEELDCLWDKTSMNAFFALETLALQCEPNMLFIDVLLIFELQI
jgi:hypothetical protein